MSKIDIVRLGYIFGDSLTRKDEIGESGEPVVPYVEALGLIHRFFFHQDRLNSHRAELLEMIDNLAPQFFSDTGGGWSFLNICFDKNESHWGEHPDAERLVALSLALGVCRYPLPVEVWPALPGGVPYVEFNKDGFKP